MKEHADILFLSSNPSNADRLEIEREARTLQRALEDAVPPGKTHLKLATCWAAEPLDLLREIRSVRPTVLHFTGYGARGTTSGIYLQDPVHGKARLVEVRALQDVLRAAGSSIRIAVLNAYYTESQVAELLEVETLDCALGMDGSINDTGGRLFILVLYQALATGHSVHTAWMKGCQVLGEQGFSEKVRPQLKTRTGVDAQQVFVEARQGV